MLYLTSTSAIRKSEYTPICTVWIKWINTTTMSILTDESVWWHRTYCIVELNELDACALALKGTHLIKVHEIRKSKHGLAGLVIVSDADAIVKNIRYWN